MMQLVVQGSFEVFVAHNKGSILHDVRRNVFGWVVQSNQHGVLAWPIRHQSAHGRSFAMLDTSHSADPLFWRVTSFHENEWLVYEHTVLSPLETAVDPGGVKLCGIYMKMSDSPMSILKFAANMGFHSIQSTYLQKLASSLQVPMVGKKTAHSKVEALIKRILGDVSDEVIVACLAAGATPEEPCLFADDAVCKGLGGVMDGEEREQCNLIQEESKKTRLKHKMLKEYLEATGRTMPAMKGLYDLKADDVQLTVVPEAMVDKAGSTSKAEKSRSVANDLPPNFRQWLPPGVTGCSLALGHGQSFCARYPRELPPRSRTITWAAEGSAGANKLEAFRACVRWLWLARIEANPTETMSFDLSSIVF